MDGRIEGSGPREDRHDYWGVVVDAPDGPALAGFYAELLGWQIDAGRRDPSSGQLPRTMCVR